LEAYGRAARNVLMTDKFILSFFGYLDCP